MQPPLLSCSLADSETLRYRVYGSGPHRLVLLHGLASRAESWTDLLPLLAPERYTVYVVDLLGSGESSKPPLADYSIRAHSRRLLDFLERQGVSDAIVHGHSLGGAVVLLAAIEAQQGRREHLVRGVINMGGPGYLQSLPLIARIFRYPVVGHLFINIYAPRAWVRYGLQAAYYDQRLVDPRHLDRYAPCYQDRSARRALVQTCRQLVPPDCNAISASFAGLRTPVLLLWGRHDRIVPLSQGERLRAAIPGARLAVIEECGHNPQEEKPDETFRIIDAFVTYLHA